MPFSVEVTSNIGEVLAGRKRPLSPTPHRTECTARKVSTAGGIRFDNGSSSLGTSLLP